MFDCVSGIYIDVQSYSSFSSVNVTNPIDASKNFTNPNNYSPGGPGDIVVVRLFYQWPIVRHQARLQHLEFERQQAAVDRDRRVPERTLLGARPDETDDQTCGFACGARRATCPAIAAVLRRSNSP